MKPSDQPAQSAEEAARVYAERDALYGDATAGHRNFGLLITAILQQHYGIVLPHPVPPRIALLINAACKLNRACLETSNKADDYVDLIRYVQLADEARKEGQ